MKEKEKQEKVVEKADAQSTIVYEDKPICPSPWKSTTSDDTMTEVDMMTIKTKRRQIRLTISRPFADLSKHYKFSDRDSDTGELDDTILM